MILMSAIANITSNLDVIRKQDGKGISSHVKLKEEALDCLKNLINNAPINEYKSMLESKNCDILIGYLMSVLCHFAKNDKSRSVRRHSLEVMNTLIQRLGNHHSGGYSTNKCAVSPLILALPGISSTLFRIILSDTKIHHEYLVKAIKTLSSLIGACFQLCPHQRTEASSLSARPLPSPHLDGDYLDQTCDNLAVRTSLLLNYIMNSNDDLHEKVKLEMINFANTLISNTHPELIKKIISPMIKYVAYLAQDLETPGSLAKDAEESLDSLTRNIEIKLSVQNADIHTAVLNCLFKTLDDLENNAIDMLFGERQSKLTTLLGTLKMLPSETLSTFFEVPYRREQFLNLFIQLTEFSTQQPLLFLTDTHIGHGAVELRNEQLYTIEKRFAHILDREISIISNCCRLIGGKSDWCLLIDMLRCELMDFTNPSKLYLVYHIMVGMMNRSITKSRAFKFTSQTLNLYVSRIKEVITAMNIEMDDAYSYDILRTVIAIESIAVIIEIHLKFIVSDPARHSIILRDLLCPLLNWSSSKSRAISEASLNTLTKISRIYGHESTHSFIKSFTDYIVDGVSQMLDNFACNPDVTNVLAITFKLSSIEVFYYFKDIYERVFILLNAYHYTDRSKSIALLFYRTLSILSEWKDASQMDSDDNSMHQVPLTNRSSIENIVKDIDIGLRLKKLQQSRENAHKIQQQMESMQLSEQSDGENIREHIEQSNGPIDQECGGSKDEPGSSEEKKKPNDVVLTEKIMKHCIGLMSSSYDDTKILALKTATQGFRILRDDEETLLPLVHQLWSPLINRLTGDYSQNLEINLCAFECLVTMAFYSKDFIKRRTLDSIIPRICLFLESQADLSRGKKEYEPYCMTMAYKCQLKLLTNLGPLAHHIQLAYSNLWRVIRVALRYLDQSQVSPLREAARTSLYFMIALDADCVWYYAKQAHQLNELPFELIYDSF